MTEESFGNFYNLDDKTKEKILDFLDSSDIKNLRTVSRAMHKSTDEIRDIPKKMSLGKLYKLHDYTIGNIIEFLNSSEVKNLRSVSKEIKLRADNEDEYTKMPKRPRHANLAMLEHYKMLDEERINEIIKNSPFPFPPNCYYFEQVYTYNDKLSAYQQFIIQGETLFIEEEEIGSYYSYYSGAKIHFNFYYINEYSYKFPNSSYYIKDYIQEGGRKHTINLPRYAYTIDLHDRITNLNHMREIFKNLRNEDYIFEVIDPRNYEYKHARADFKFGIKKIS